MKKYAFIFVPFILAFYCIAFFEVNIVSTQHQSWDDNFDSYTVSHSKDLNTDHFALHNLHPGPGLSTAFANVINNNSQKAFPQFFEPGNLLYNHKLFINNCTWLI